MPSCNYAIAANRAGARLTQLRPVSGVIDRMEPRNVCDPDVKLNATARGRATAVVALPRPHDGIANALRSAYGSPGVPDEWTQLLARLR